MPASPEIRQLVRQADAARARREEVPLRFSTVRGACTWLARQGARLQAPRAAGRPRLAAGPGGPVAIPGSTAPGGGLEDSIVTALSIRAAIDAALRVSSPQQARAVVAVLLEDQTQADAAALVGASQPTVSRWVARVEAQVAPALRGAGIIS